MADRALYGWEEYVTWGQEITYGTKDATGDWACKPLSFGLVNNDPALQLGGPTGYPVGWMYDASLPREYKGVPDCSGDIAWEADYDDIGWILKNALQVTPANVAYDTLGFTHTYAIPATADPPVQSFSIHRETAGLTDATANKELGELFRGCHVDKLTLSGEPGKLITATASIIGQDSVLEATNAPTYSAAPWIEFHETSMGSGSPDSATPITAGSLSLAQHDCTSWTFEVENNLRAIGGGGLGKRAIREPINSGYRTIRLTITKDFIDREWQDAFRAEGTAGYYGVTLRLTSDTLGGWDSALLPYRLTIHIPSARVLSPPPEYGGGPDIIEETLVFEAAWGTTAGICDVILDNSIASYPDAS